MTTRYTARPRHRFGVAPLPSGYDPTSSTGDVTVPSCGIEDVDRALFALFEREIPLIVSTNDQETKRVPVVFASRERWDMVRKGAGVVDRNGSLILPLVTIVRESVRQTLDADTSGRGANQHVGELVVRRRLSPQDRGWQNIVNRQDVRNQQNVSVQPGDETSSSQPLTLNDVGDLSTDPTIATGGGLINDRSRNIVETFTVPTPQKVTIRYRLMLWAQYQQQANAMIEACLSSYLPQTKGWRIETTKGYWFNAFVSSDDFASKGNEQDMSREERIIRHEFNVEVPCFVLASSAPGQPVHVKRHVSAPVISFGVSVGSAADSLSSSIVDEPFLGADDPTLPLTNGRSNRRDARQTNHGRVFPAKNVVNENDPALGTLRRGTSLGRWERQRTFTGDRFTRVMSRSPGGETVVSGGDLLGGITVIAVDE